MSEFALSEGWGGVVEGGRDLELVEVRGGEDLLEAERLEAHLWRVRHRPNEPLSLTFELGATAHRQSPTPPEYYLPILERGLLHALGGQTLPTPTHLDGSVARPIALAWRGFEAAGWKTVSSFGRGDLETTRALDAFRHALFFAGDLRLHERTLRGHMLCVGASGAWKFADEDLVGMAETAVTLGRSFFDDFEFPFYLISLIQVGTPGAGTSSLGGTGLSDSFALFLTPEMTLAEQQGGGGVLWLLTHELLHEWNGLTVTLAQPEQLGYWFSEGFTNFYTRRLLHRAGKLDDDAFVAAWNRTLAAQAANPERFAPAERVREAFWSEPQVGELPYQRGDLIALFLDHAIRVRSAGRQSLDDALRSLVARARAGAPPHTSESLCQVFAEFAGPEAAESVLRWALEGLEPELPPAALGDGLRLLTVEHPTYATGFDDEATLASGKVVGVVSGGPAERAGLRDGQRFVSWRVNSGAVDQPIEVTVLEGGERRVFRYLPHGRSVRGYRVVRDL